MTPLESMRLRMAETGLYTFSGQTAGTALDWELEAYNAGLELFYEQVKGLLENSFPETAGEDALSLWESLLGICGEGLAEEERRRRLLLRVSAVPGSKGGLQRAAEAMGVSISIAEEPGRICCMAEGMPGEKEISRFKRSIGGFVPAHLRIYLDCRPLSWQDIEEKGYSWQQMDNASMSWQAIHSLGGGIVEIPIK